MTTKEQTEMTTSEPSRDEMERAARVVKRHAQDEEDLSYLLDALGLAV